MRQLARLTAVLLVAGYWAVLNWSYATVEAELYGYLGIAFGMPPFYQVLGLLLAVLPSFWLDVRADRPSLVCQWIMYLSLVVPITIVPFHVLDGSPASIAALPVSVVACFALLCAAASGKPLHLPWRPAGHRLVVPVLIIATALISGYLIWQSGLVMPDVFSDTIYERRVAAEDEVAVRSVWAYAMAIMSGAMAPFLIAIGYVHRHKAAFAVGVLGLYGQFCFNAAKASLLTILFISLIVWPILHMRRHFGLVATGAVIGLVLVSGVLYVGWGSIDLEHLLVNRQIFMPSQLTSCYWDFFSRHPKVLYSDGFLRWFVESRYDLPTPRIIGEAYLWGADTHANANLWASAYANLGYLGMVITSALAGTFLRLIDGASDGGDFPVVAALSGYYAITWANVALETSMLTHGVAVALLIMHLWKPPGVACPTAHAQDRPSRYAAKAVAVARRPAPGVACWSQGAKP